MSFTTDSATPGVAQRSVVLEYALAGGVPSGAPEELLVVDQPYANHNGGHLAFDTDTGDLWIADVGQNTREEITRFRSVDGGGLGANLGWDRWEGTHLHEAGDPVAPSHTGPTYEYTTNGLEGGSITRGCVYRGTDIVGLNGTYLWADWKEPELRGFNDELSGGAIWFGTDVPGGSVVSFLQDLDGEVYAISHNGSISKVVDAG